MCVCFVFVNGETSEMKYESYCTLAEEAAEERGPNRTYFLHTEEARILDEHHTENSVEEDMKIVEASNDDDAALPDAGAEAGAEAGAQAVCSMVPDTDTDTHHRAHTGGMRNVP